MAKKRIGEIEEDILIAGALGIAGYFLFKNLLPNLNLGGSAADKATIATINTLPGNSNPFNISYQYSLYGQAPSAYGQSFYNNLAATYLNNTAGASGGTLDIAFWGENINNAMGEIVETDSEIDNIFSMFTSQADVSNVAAYLYFNYQIDLLTLLQNGRGIIPFVNNGLSTSHLATIVNHVNSLPPQ